LIVTVNTLPSSYSTLKAMPFGTQWSCDMVALSADDSFARIIRLRIGRLCGSGGLGIIYPFNPALPAMASAGCQ